MAESVRQHRFVLFVLIAFCLLFITGYTSRLIHKAQLQAEVQLWQTRIEQARQKQTTLQAERAYVKSDAYVHQKARELLGLAQPTDKLVVVVESTPATIAPTSPDQAQLPSTAKPLPNWQQWLQLFVPAAEEKTSR
jgi:cell division protein FtsL